MKITDDSWFGSTVHLTTVEGEQYVPIMEFLSFNQRQSNKIEVLQKIIDEQRENLEAEKRVCNDMIKALEVSVEENKCLVEKQEAMLELIDAQKYRLSVYKEIHDQKRAEGKSKTCNCEALEIER